MNARAGSQNGPCSRPGLFLIHCATGHASRPQHPELEGLGSQDLSQVEALSLPSEWSGSAGREKAGIRLWSLWGYVEQSPSEEALQPPHRDIRAGAGQRLLREPPNAILLGLILELVGPELNVFWQNCPPLKPHHLIPTSQPAAPLISEELCLVRAFRISTGQAWGRRQTTAPTVQKSKCKEPPSPTGCMASCTVSCSVEVGEPALQAAARTLSRSRNSAPWMLQFGTEARSGQPSVHTHRPIPGT